MKICLISNLRSEGYGVSTRAYYISKHLSQFGNEVLHICDNSSENVKEVSFDDFTDHRNIKYVEKIHYKNGIKLINNLKNVKYLIKEIEKFNPDVIYPHMLFNGYKILWLNKFFKKPIIYDADTSNYFEMITVPNHEYNILREIIGILEKKILKKSNGIITVSAETKKFFIDTYKIETEKIEIAKNGTNTKTFKPGPKDTKILYNLGIRENDKICVFTNPRFFGYKTNYYGLDYLFDIVPKIEKKIEDIKFLIIGGGPEPKPPSTNVIYTGFVKNLPPYINLADVCLAPYPTEAVCGGTRNKICDYLACGKPIVSTPEGMRGFDDAIPNEHYFLGINKEYFVNKLIYCLRNLDEVKTIGKNARSLSLRYDWEISSKKVEEYLKKFLM